MQPVIQESHYENYQILLQWIVSTLRLNYFFESISYSISIFIPLRKRSFAYCIWSLIHWLILIIGYYRGLKISRYVFFFFEKLFARATIHVFKVEKWPIQYSHWSLYFIMDPSDIYSQLKSNLSPENPDNFWCSYPIWKIQKVACSLKMLISKNIKVSWKNQKGNYTNSFQNQT
jgi:hypothetical protein